MKSFKYQILGCRIYNVQQNCNFIVYICIQLGSEDRMPACHYEIDSGKYIFYQNGALFIRTEHLEKINLPTICGDSSFVFNSISQILKLFIIFISRVQICR